MDRDRFRRKLDEDVVPRDAPPRPMVKRPEIRSATPVAAPKPIHRPIHPPHQPAAHPRPAVHKPSPKPDEPAEPNLPNPRPAAAVSKEYKRLSKKKIAAIALILAILVGAGSQLLPKSPKTATKSSAAKLSGLHVDLNSGASKSTAAVAGTVPFTPVVPQDKPQLGRLGSTAYNSQYKSYSFDDVFQDNKIRVSEQELPSGQDTAATLIDKISASLKAQSVTPVPIQSGQPAYLLNGTGKAGAQVVVFSVKGRLLFVQSAISHDAATWTDYLNTFQ
jgi:hypothetical protein